MCPWTMDTEVGHFGFSSRTMLRIWSRRVKRLRNGTRNAGAFQRFRTRRKSAGKTRGLCTNGLLPKRMDKIDGDLHEVKCMYIPLVEWASDAS